MPLTREQENLSTFENMVNRTMKDEKNFTESVRPIIDKTRQIINKQSPNTEPHIRVSLTLDDMITGTKKIVELPNGKRIELTIPSGTSEDTIFRIATPENTYRIGVEPEPSIVFERQGDDLTTEIHLFPQKCNDGTEIPLPTITGQVMLTIMPNTQEDTRIRLKGQGMPTAADPECRGDLILTVKHRKG